MYKDYIVSDSKLFLSSILENEIQALEKDSQQLEY